MGFVMLNRHFLAIISGIVRHGKKKARLLGAATANIAHSLDLKEGVYFAYTSVAAKKLKEVPSMVYITKNMLEAHLIGRKLGLYHLEITVKLVFYIRATIPFISSQQMRRQIEKDLRQINCYCLNLACNS
jgi:FAD synthase